MTFIKNILKTTRRNMTSIHFLKEQLMKILFLKVSFCFPSAKSNKQGGKVFLRKFGVFQGKIFRPCLFFENTREILIIEYPLGNIMCIRNFYIAFLYWNVPERRFLVRIPKIRKCVPVPMIWVPIPKIW